GEGADLAELLVDPVRAGGLDGEPLAPVGDQERVVGGLVPRGALAVPRDEVDDQVHRLAGAAAALEGEADGGRAEEGGGGGAGGDAVRVAAVVVAPEPARLAAQDGPGFPSLRQLQVLGADDLAGSVLPAAGQVEPPGRPGLRAAVVTEQGQSVDRGPSE